MPWLEWHNRNNDLKATAKTPYRLLQPIQSLSYGDEDAPNMLIQGDNLEALKALLPYYGGRVKCVFIDPPYNTKSAFEHYDDNLEHAQWLSMMYPRMVLLRELLREDGSIWITLDDNEAHYFKVMCDEIFGRSNFFANCLWQKVYSERMDAKGFSVSHDHILVYGKSSAFKPQQLAKAQNAGQFGFYDEKMKKYYRRRSLRKEGSESLRRDRPSMWYVIEAPDGSPIWPVKPDGTEGRWRWKKENVPKNKDSLEFVNKEGVWEIYVKQYLETDPTRPSATFWPTDEVGHNHEAKLEVRKFNPTDVFDTPKPERLIERILRISTNPKDIVLDSFLGSGTTSAVAHKMGRRWIGVEMGGHARTHCQPRLVEVVDGEQGGISKKEDWKGGGGFRFYQLGSKIFDDQGRINPEIKFEHLAAHIWFAETGVARSTRAMKSPLLGVHDGTAYYLLYNGVLGDTRLSSGNMLTMKVLASLPKHNGPTVIYGEGTNMTNERLRSLGIDFKKTPNDIGAR